MNKAAKLAELVALQKLHEQRCEGDVTETARTHSRTIGEAERLARVTDRAGAALDDVFASPVLCPDQMLLAAGHLAIARNDQARGDADLDVARQAEELARRDWQQASYRSRHLIDRHRDERRAENRRCDDARQNQQLALRAALSKGPKA